MGDGDGEQWVLGNYEVVVDGGRGEIEVGGGRGKRYFVGGGVRARWGALRVQEVIRGGSD